MYFFYLFGLNKLMGDFNVDWNPDLPDSLNRLALCDFADSLNLVQLVSDVTRPSTNSNSTGSIIDLVFCSAPEHVSHVQTVSNPVSSDHHAVQITLNCRRTPPPSSVVRQFVTYNQASVDHLNALLAYAPWDLFLDTGDINESWEGFLDIVYAAMKDALPSRSAKSRKRRNCPWVNLDMKRLCRQKHKLFKKAKSSGSLEDWNCYKTVRNKLKFLSRKAYKAYVDKLFLSNDNRKRFWAYVRSRRQSPTPLSFKQGDNILTDYDDIATAFNSYFASVFSEPSNVPDNPPSCDFPIDDLSTIHFSTGSIRSIILSLPQGKAPGPDGIGVRFLSNTVDSISPVLCRIFQTSIRCGCLPLGWKTANITPVFKSGDRSCLNNYRPVALTSTVCKVMERVISDVILRHLDDYCLISANQHGFLPHRSCVTQLLNVYHTWAAQLDQRNPPRIDAVFLDMSKAFDRMPHDTLLHKLASGFNIGGALWSWIKDFLVGRLQRVTFVGRTSEWSLVKSGVPQGSVLGPLLFNLFINDISRNINSPCVLFADDVLLYRSIRTDLDVSELQNDLNELSAWSASNGMTFNTSKTKIMHISRKRAQFFPAYILSGTALTASNTVKYLGVTLSAQLSWNDHIKSVSSSANRMLGFIKTVAFNASVHAKLALYKALVLPIVEYGLPAWLPQTKKQDDTLENIQRRATRFILGQKRGVMSYTERLEILNWSTLSNRRNFAVLSLVCKCLLNLVKCEMCQTKVTVNSRHTNIVSFNHLQARTQSLHLSCFHQFPRLWSNLPEHVSNALILKPFSQFLAVLKNTVLYPDS